MENDFHVWRLSNKEPISGIVGSGLLLEPRVGQEASVAKTIRNFFAKMPQGWIVQIFHSNINGRLLLSHPEIFLLIQQGRVLLHCLHVEYLPYPEGVNAFLTSPHLWNVAVGEFGYS